MPDKSIIKKVRNIRVSSWMVCFAFTWVVGMGSYESITWYVLRPEVAARTSFPWYAPFAIRGFFASFIVVPILIYRFLSCVLPNPRYYVSCGLYEYCTDRRLKNVQSTHQTKIYRSKTFANIRCSMLNSEGYAWKFEVMEVDPPTAVPPSSSDKT